MLKKSFDPTKPYPAVLYLRMSTDRQNPRSPEQQEEEIRRRIRALGWNWSIVKIYRDDGISGRYLRKREGYQRMLRDLKSGAVVADLILVDSLERFGRVEELSTIRKQLHERHGILILTADSNFTDPNTPAGKALGMVESMRATEDGRVKAHNVFRGKRDAALQKHWPGGVAPFGFGLKSIMTTIHGREEVDHSILEPDPETSWIMKRLFALAEETGHGTTRLAKAMNADPDIPAIYKPFQPETIGYWLDSEIYFGELVWAKKSTGIVDDTLVAEPNAPDDVIRVPEFCEGIVSREQWDKVQTMREVRRQRLAESKRRKETPSGKQIQPLAPGITLNYMLSGLVFCECGLRMTASSSSVYVTQQGDERRYVSYVCPGYLAGHCQNGTRVPESWLRKVVVGQLSERLFATDN